MLAQPNFLFIMADQLVPMLTGAYGHPVVQTPNLDRLVEMGVRFDAAYTPVPICCPARECMMSGKYSSNNGCYDNAAPLLCDEPTIAHYLTNAGYDTVLSGKMHYVGPDQLHGFRMRMVNNIYPADFRWTTRNDGQGMLFSEQKFPPEDWDFIGAYLGENIHPGRWNANLSYDEETHFRALEYLRAQRDFCATHVKSETQPWFLFVSYHHPHEVFWPPQDIWALYEDADIDVPNIPEDLESTYSEMDRWMIAFHGTSGDQVDKLTAPESIKEVRRAYYASVTYIDRKVGELLVTLEEQGFDDNTVIIFTSDHGDMLGERGMLQKRNFYEWSSRVPLLMTLPGNKYAGRIITDSVSLVDLMPTMLDLAGVDQQDRLDCDGRSLLPLLDGGEETARYAFSEMHTEGVFTPCFMVRQGAFKYVYIHGEDEQLFNIDADPGEWHNLANQLELQDVKADLKALIFHHFEPEKVARQAGDSIERRRLIQKALMHNGTAWSASANLGTTGNTMQRYLP